MDEDKDRKAKTAVDQDIEGIVLRESEEALRRFHAGDFAGKLKSRLEALLPKQPFVLFHRPVFVPALGLLVLAAGALAVFFFVARSNERIRIEAGFRHMTEALSRSALFQTGVRSGTPVGPGETPAEGSLSPFAEALSRTAGGREAGSENGSAGPAEGGAPLRPLFSPRERFKILFEDRVILRVLTNIANQKEV